MKKYYLVYGKDGRKQKASFWGSGILSYKERYDMTVFSAEDTGTHDFSLVIIDSSNHRNRSYLDEEIRCGYFADCEVGKVVEISEDDFTKIMA